VSTESNFLLRHGRRRNQITLTQMSSYRHSFSTTQLPAMTTMDPLDLFRQAISASTPPTLLDAASEAAESLQLATYISFPTEPPTNITKETATRYTSKADSKDEFYSIGQLWLAWTEKDAGVRDYLMKGQAGGVGYVGIADRRGVVEYLQGESDGGARIVSATAVEGQSNCTKATDND
jgi:hypothetical protein